MFITNWFTVQGLRFKVCISEFFICSGVRRRASGVRRQTKTWTQSSVLSPQHFRFILFLLIPCTLYLIPTTLPAANAAQVTLAWDQNPESDIAGYKIHYGTLSGSYNYSVDVGNYTSCTISGLAEGTMYYFAATAYNANNIASGLSEELAYTIPVADSDGDGISDNDEINTYGTDPDKSDTDGDGISDGEELSFWGNNWNADSDNDGIVNLMDADSDGDGYTDGDEIAAGSGPADNASVPQENPQVTVYEDADDGETNGWAIYDGTPSGAKIFNVFDTTRQSRVIALSGSGIDNGFRLQLESLLPWKNSSQFNIEWSHQFSENFIIYIDIETTGGHRYIQYKPVNYSDYGTGEYVRIGIGSDAQDGTWRSYARDLEADLEAAQPGTEILEVNGFLIRGSGKVDDIRLRGPDTSNDNLIHVAASSGAGGTIAPLGDILVVSGSDQMFTITPDTGYDVADVLVDGSSAGAITEYSFQNITENHTIAASFEIKTFSITVTSEGSGTISPPGITYVPYGKNQTYTIKADDSFHIEDVRIDGVSVGAVSSYSFEKLDAPHTIFAAFAQNNQPPLEDADQDGIDDRIDNCPHLSNPDQRDTDNDGVGDGCDAFAEDPDEWLDTDTDGTGNNADPDDDNDGISDVDEIQKHGTDPFNPDTDKDGYSDNEEIVAGTDPNDPSVVPENNRIVTVYEDAEDGTTAGWFVYDSKPAGATINNVFDNSRGSRVIQLSGQGINNGFRLQNDDQAPWENTSQFVIQWSMQFASQFVIYVAVNTTAGQRYLNYQPVDYNKLGNGEYVRMGLGKNASNGQWHTFVRDLQKDLNSAQPGVKVTAANGFIVRGSGRIDDIKLYSGMDADNDGLTIEEELFDYATDPANPDSDGDGYWDADEIDAGSDPLDATSSPDLLPTDTLYENADDGTTNGWVIYDSSPAGAAVDNVYDEDTGSRVIKLSGTGIDNGFRLGGDDLTPWRNADQFVIEWDMQFSEYFVIYIDLETTAGHRYIQYKPVDYSDYGTGEYIRIGIGSDAQDGTWRSYARDLEVDLKAAQPGTEILEVNGFLIRGSGKVDDILLKSSD